MNILKPNYNPDRRVIRLRQKSFGKKIIHILLPKKNDKKKSEIEQTNKSNEILIKQELWINPQNNEIEQYSRMNLNFENTLKQNVIEFKNLSKEYNYTPEELEIRQLYQIWTIIEIIQQYTQEISYKKIDEKRTEIINKIKTHLIYIPEKEKQKILTAISEIIDKISTITKYTDFENWPYKNHKELLYAITWITDPRIINNKRANITFKQYWPCIIFFIDQRYFYNLVITWWKNKLWNWSSWTYFREEWNIAELEWTLIVINWNGKDNKSKRMEKHDSQHMRNTYFMPKDEQPINEAKDEITAYLRDWRWIFKKSEVPETILSLLTQWWNEYQYWLEWEEREEHKKQVKELLLYANWLIELTKDKKTGLKKENIINMLSYIPRNQRKKLYTTTMEAVRIHNERNTLSDEKIWEKQHIPKIKQHLVNLRNSKFLSHKNLSNWVELRRTWTASKQSELDEISIANSFNEIKHILNNPKYLHISRWDDKKSWIEVSTIMDEVIAWNLPITYIPIEIRQKVKELINKEKSK